MPAGGLNSRRASLLVSSQKWLPLRYRPYTRADQLFASWRAVPISTSSTRRGVRSSSNSLPEEDATGVVANSVPVASKCALIVVARLRSHDAARGSELAAGL